MTRSRSSTRSVSVSTSWIQPRFPSAWTTTCLILVFNLADEHAIRQAVLGKKVGTLVKN